MEKFEINAMETVKGTVTFHRTSGEWEPGMIGFQAQLNGETVMTVLVDTNDDGTEVDLSDFFAFFPGEDWNDVHYLGEECDDAMAKLKKEIEAGERIYAEDNLMLEAASITPREYDGGFIDNPDGECSPSDWEIPSGTIGQVKAWFKENIECDVEDGRVIYYTLYSLDRDGYVNEPIIEARPVFTVVDDRDKTHGHYTRFDEAQTMVDKLWNINLVDAVIDVETEFKD